MKRVTEIKDIGVQSWLGEKLVHIIREFFGFIGPPISEQEHQLDPVGTFLFPRCLQMPGWKRSVDVLFHGRFSISFLSSSEDTAHTHTSLS